MDNENDIFEKPTLESRALNIGVISTEFAALSLVLMAVGNFQTSKIEELSAKRDGIITEFFNESITSEDSPSDSNSNNITNYLNSIKLNSNESDYQSDIILDKEVNKINREITKTQRASESTKNFSVSFAGISAGGYLLTAGMYTLDKYNKRNNTKKEDNQKDNQEK